MSVYRCSLQLPCARRQHRIADGCRFLLHGCKIFRQDLLRTVPFLRSLDRPWYQGVRAPRLCQLQPGAKYLPYQSHHPEGHLHEQLVVGIYFCKICTWTLRAARVACRRQKQQFYCSGSIPQAENLPFMSKLMKASCVDCSSLQSGLRPGFLQILGNGFVSMHCVDLCALTARGCCHLQQRSLSNHNVD